MKDDNVQDVTFSWEEGRYFDLWMIVHVLGGVVLAMFTLLVDLGRIPGYALALVIGAGWEVAEYFLKVRERQENRVLDVLLEMVGFGLMFESMREVTPEAYPSIFILSLVMFALLSLIGWLDHKRRSEKE